MICPLYKQEPGTAEPETKVISYISTDIGSNPWQGEWGSVPSMEELALLAFKG